MDKKIIIIVISLIIMSGIIGTYNKKEDSKDSSSVLRIAIFEPASHPALDEIVQGFIETLFQSKRQYTFERFNANGNKILLRSLAEEIIQNKFDLIFTVGIECSLTIKNLSLKKQCSTPIVFTGVDNPQKIGLVGERITGVSTQPCYSQQIEILTDLIPSVRKILLIYDPTQGCGLESDKEQLALIFNKKGIKLTAIEIESISEISQKATIYMPQIDVVMVLKDNTIVSGLDSLIELCRRYHKPLFASDLNSVIKGATFAYGIREYDSGSEAALKAQLILEYFKKPAEIAVSSIKRFKTLINKKAVETQGFMLLSQKNSEYTSIELY